MIEVDLDSDGVASVGRQQRDRRTLRVIMCIEQSAENRNPSQRLRQRAEEMLATTRTDIANMHADEIQKLIHEFQVHQMELKIQNEDLRDAQIELAHSRDRYADLYAFAPVGYLTLDRHSVIHEANLTAAHMLGVERKYLVGQKLTDYLADDAQECWHLHRRSLFSRETKQACELSIMSANRGPLSVRLESRAFLDEDGNLSQCRTALVDVSSERRAQQQLAASEKRYRETLKLQVDEQTKEINLLATAISSLGEGVLITSDHLEWPEPPIIFVNDALCQITGYAAEELLGNSPRFLYGVDDNNDREVLDRVKADLSAGRSCLAELTNYRKGGQRYDSEMFITPLFGPDGSRTNFVSIHRDITERKQAVEALRREHELSEGIINAAQQIILLLDTEGRIVRINPFMEQLSGWQLAEVRGRDWFDTFLPERDCERSRDLFRRSLLGKPILGNVNSIVTKEGRELNVEWHDASLKNEDGEYIGLLCIGQDFTARRRAEQSQRMSDEKLRAVLNTATDAIVTIDRHGIIDSVNPAVAIMFRYTEDELVGQNVKMLMPANYGDEHDSYIARYLATGQARIIGSSREVTGRNKEGTTFPISLSVAEVDHLGLFTGIIRDISERKKLQREVLSIAEDEQRRIGQDLHDSTQQELAGIGMMVQTLLNNLEKGSIDPKKGKSPAELCELAKKIMDGIARAQKDVQAVARGLIPVLLLDEGGLMDALRELAYRTDELEGVSCAFKCEQPVMIADNLTATSLYRIAQEAVANALKHGQPEHILIVLDSDNGQTLIQIADDGVGFDSNAPSEGMGLKTMRYRASLIGAKLTVDPVERGGTLVSCNVFGGGVACDD